MRKVVITSVVLVAGLAAFWFGRPLFDDSRPQSVAIIDGEAIGLDEFGREYADYLLSTGLPDNPRRRTDFLQRLISVELLVREQADAGIRETDAFKAHENRIRRKLLIEGYLREVVYDTLSVSEDELANMFVRVNTTLKASHLYAPTLRQAETLYDRLQEGETFEQLAREVFQSEELAESGGSIGYFQFDEMDPAFEEAAFALAPGSVSKPVRTAQGYSIIRLDDRFEKPVMTEYEFATKKDDLKRYVSVRKRQQAKQSFYDRLEAEAAPQVRKEAFDRLYRGLTGRGIDNDESGSGMDMSTVLVEFDGRVLTVQQFFDESMYTSLEQRMSVTTPEALEAFLEGIVIRLAILRRAEEAGVGRSSAFKQALGNETDEWIYERAWDDIRSNIVVAEDSARAHLEAFPDDFAVPEQVHVREILVDESSEAVALRNRVDNSNFASLAAEYSIRPGADANGGELGFVTREQLGVLAGKVFGAQKGQILGPLEVQGKYALLLIGERLPPQPPTFEAVRPQVEERLRSAMLRDRVNEHVEALRGRYRVSVDQQALGQTGPHPRSE